MVWLAQIKVDSTERRYEASSVRLSGLDSVLDNIKETNLVEIISKTVISDLCLSCKT